MLALKTTIQKIKALQKLEKCSKYVSRWDAPDSIYDEVYFDEDIIPVREEIEACYEENKEYYEKFEVGDIVEGTRINEDLNEPEIVPGEVIGFVNGEMILHFAEDIDSADGSVDIYPLKDGYAELIEDYNPEDYYYIFDPVEPSEDYGIEDETEIVLFHAFGEDVAENLLEPIREDYSKRDTERTLAIDKFMAVCLSCPIIIPLFSLACRQMLEIHDNTNDAESASAIFCNSDKESVHFSSEVSNEERDLVRKFMSMSPLFNGDSGVELCKVLCKIHKSEIAFQNSEAIELYKNVYNKFYAHLDEDKISSLSTFLLNAIDVNWREGLYLPFMTRNLLPFALKYVGVKVTADYTDSRNMVFDLYNTSFAINHHKNLKNEGRPIANCRDLTEWFEKDKYGTIVCEMPDSNYQADFLLEKLLTVNYERAYVVVPASFLGCSEKVFIREKLIKSGRLSGVTTLPEMGIGDFALVELSSESFDEIVLTDLHGLSLTRKDNCVSNGWDIHNLVDFYNNSYPGIEVWQKYIDDIPHDELVSSGYVLNPKYYINPLAPVDDESKYDNIELSKILTLLVPDISNVNLGDTFVESSYELAPSNEFEKAKFERSFLGPTNTPCHILAEKDCLVWYTDCNKGFYANRMFYWKSDKSIKLDVGGEYAFLVNTKLVNVQYLIHQLYRPETYLQIRQKQSLSDVGLELLGTNDYLSLKIRVPKGKDSLKIQKKIYEEQKDLFLCKFNGIQGIDEFKKVNKKYSRISIGRKTINFLDYHISISMEPKLFPFYVFLLRNIVDVNGEHKDVQMQDIGDYIYEISRVFYAVKNKNNSFIDSPDLPFDYFKSIETINEYCSIANGFTNLSGIITKINNCIREGLNGRVEDEITNSYLIPKGKSKNRNVKLNVEILIEDGLFPRDYFKRPCEPDSCFEESLGRIASTHFSKDTLPIKIKKGNLKSTIRSIDGNGKKEKRYEVAIEESNIHNYFECNDEDVGSNVFESRPSPLISRLKMKKYNYMAFYEEEECGKAQLYKIRYYLFNSIENKAVYSLKKE